MDEATYIYPAYYCPWWGRVTAPSNPYRRSAPHCCNKKTGDLPAAGFSFNPLFVALLSGDRLYRQLALSNLNGGQSDGVDDVVDQRAARQIVYRLA